MTDTYMVYSVSTILPSQYMDIVPSTVGEEWTIHNIIIPFGYTCEIYQSNGAIDILIVTTSMSLLSYHLHCDTSYYYRVKNTSGTTINVSYNGIVMNE